MIDPMNPIGKTTVNVNVITKNPISDINYYNEKSQGRIISISFVPRRRLSTVITNEKCQIIFSRRLTMNISIFG